MKLCRINLVLFWFLISTYANHKNPELWQFQTYLGSSEQLDPRFGRLIWERPSPAQPASLPFFTRTVCMAPDLLSQKCFWDFSLHKGAIKCVSLPAGSADSWASGHIQLIVPINFSQRTPGLLQEPALPWNRKLYLHCLGAWCSSIKGKRVL